MVSSGNLICFVSENMEGFDQLDFLTGFCLKTCELKEIYNQSRHVCFLTYEHGVREKQGSQAEDW